MSRRTRGVGHVNHERWLVSYADFITLLFAFFVVLYASSQVDKQKMAQMAAAIEGAFQKMGVFAGSTRGQINETPAPAEEWRSKGAALPKSVDPIATIKTADAIQLPVGSKPLPSPSAASIAELQRELEKALELQLKRKQITLRPSPEGLIVSLSEMGFFASGSAVMKPEAEPSFAMIAKPLVEHQFSVRIEGHTDNMPIHSERFRSNWELSTARATEVIRLLINNYGCAPERLSAAGYGEFHPIASNATEEGRSQNRRVDLVILAGSDARSAMLVHSP